MKACMKRSMTERSFTWRGCFRERAMVSRDPAAIGGDSPTDPATRRRAGGAGARRLSSSRALLPRVGLAGAKKLLGRGPPVDLGLRPARLFQRLGAELRRHDLLELELLLGGQREQLVGRLLRVQAAFRTLASGNDRSQRFGVVADILDDLRLHGHGLAEAVHAGIEPGPGSAHAGIHAQRLIEVTREELADAGIELVDPEIDALR